MTSRTLIPLVILAILLPATEGLAKKPKVRAKPTINWSSMDHSRFDVMYEEGVLASCAYRALKDGESLEGIHLDRLKLKVTKVRDDKLEFELFFSDRAGGENLDEALVKDAFQTTISTCYDKLSD